MQILELLGVGGAVPLKKAKFELKVINSTL